jgi:predicted nucleotidyltransferase
MIRKADWRLAERLKCSLLEHNIPLYQLIVFGSRARGDAGPESDLDVLVLVEHVDAAIRKTISHCAWEIGFTTGVLIQTVVMTREEAEHGPEQSSLLMLAVKEEGISV